MKLGPKLAIAFAAMAVVPMALSSFVFLRSTAEVARDMQTRMEATYTQREVNALARATRLGVSAFNVQRGQLMADGASALKEIVARFETPPSPEAISAADTSGVRRASDTGGGTIDLSRGAARLETDANRDLMAGIIARLDGVDDVARITYLRYPDIVENITLALDVGATLWFPDGATIEPEDPREQEWYLATLETIRAGWYPVNVRRWDQWSAAFPIERENGSLIGVLRFAVSVPDLLDQTIGAAFLPRDVTAHLIVVPTDDPQLFPHRLATRTPDDENWSVEATPERFLENGDESWLKVLSDMRTGVDGIVPVTREGIRELWSFGSLGDFEGGGLYFALTLPAEVLQQAEGAADQVVRTAFQSQFRDAALFALLAASIAVLLALISAKRLVRPIKALHDAALKLGQGDFSVRVSSSGNDEIADLMKGFNQMAPALEDQVRLSNDVQVAREIQQQLVPAAQPRIDGFDVAGRARYCDETGGDYLDFVDIANRRTTACIVGDVTGHGVSAALMMAGARAALRSSARSSETVTDLMQALNRDIVSDATGGRFLTLFYVEISRDNDQITWFCCGHEPALLLDPQADTFTELSADDIPLGVDGDWHFTPRTTDLPEQAILIAYSDGIREALNSKKDPYGVDRLKKTILAARQRGSDAIAGAVLDDVTSYCGDQPAVDDQTILVIRRG